MTMTKEELNAKIALHKKWLSGDQGGVRLDLHGCDLLGANLLGADLRETNLHGADIRGADIDYSCWGLSCKTLSVKIDKRIACQLLYHTIRAMQSVDDEECKSICNNDAVIELANKFHRVEECGKINKLEENNVLNK